MEYYLYGCEGSFYVSAQVLFHLFYIAGGYGLPFSKLVLPMLMLQRFSSGICRIFACFGYILSVLPAWKRPAGTGTKTGSGQQRVQTADCIEFRHIIKSPDMLTINKNLGDGITAIGPLYHNIPQPGFCGDINLNKINAFFGKHSFGGDTIRAGRGCVNFDFGHPVFTLLGPAVKEKPAFLLKLSFADRDMIWGRNVNRLQVSKNTHVLATD